MDTSSGYSKHFFSFWDINTTYVYQFMKYAKCSDNNTIEQEEIVPSEDTINSDVAELNTRLIGVSFQENEGNTWQRVDKNPLTFTKICTAEITDAGASWLDMLSEIRLRKFKVEKFCRLSRQPHHIRCGKCKRILVTEKERITLYPLPSPEVFDLWENCFCNKTNQKECLESFPKPSRFNCYVGRLFFVMDVDNLQNNFDILAHRQPILKCSFCKQDFGILKDEPSSGKLFSRHALTIYHGLADLVDADNKTFVNLSFDSKEEYYAWILYSESEDNFAKKIVLADLRDGPQVIIWLMTSVWLMVCSDFPTQTNRPFFSLRLKYLIINDDYDNRQYIRNSIDVSSVTIRLPRVEIDYIVGLLQKSNSLYPEVMRKIGIFTTGFLRLADATY
ncbi:hypothetical protein T10_2933 [Trichinella papuae]|uniref:Uncharacterized protein n=1 Tax=Trichinella papuae TaxID=268474 RepID=A0A0V1MGY0_9BILA|nr:hypothetical protein T10_2933 [Trichinella papuae]